MKLLSRRQVQPAAAPPASGRVDAIVVGGEVLLEHPLQLRRHRIVGLGVGPRRARVEERVGHVRAAGRDLDTEVRVGPGRDVVEGAVEGCPDHRAGVGDVHPLPDPVRSARPAGVDQPDRDVVALEALDQHRGVLARVAGQERRPEAGREGRLRLLDADLGAGELGGVAADEVVGGLLAGQPRDRRQDTERVGGQEDDRARRAGDAGLVGVADEVERVGAAGVLGEPLRVEVELAGGRVEVDVLEDRPEPPRRLEDVGLVHRRQADRLGVAAALEVEGEPVAPAVLVVADQAAQRIGRERRLARPRQPEEDGRVAVRVRC